MATVQFPKFSRAPIARRVTTRNKFARRTLLIIGVMLSFTFAIVTNPGAEQVQASGLFGGLRTPGDAAFIAGHRGDRTIAPENTMPALQAALDGPMAFVETDIQLSADGVPVLMHDDWVNRTTNGSGRVGQLTLSQLEELDAGSWFSPEFAGTRIPTLEVLLEALRKANLDGVTKMALLELKGYWSESEVTIVTELIAKYSVGHLVIMSSFDTSSLQHLENVDASLPRAILTSTMPRDPVGFARLYGAVALITSQRAVEENPWAVDRIHRAGLGILLYTLNSRSRWKEAMDLGVDGIITDQPHRLDSWIAAMARS